MSCTAGTKKPPCSAASHNLLKPCPSLFDGVVRGAEEEGLDHQVVSFKSPADTPRNARNAAEIHGFCAAVPEVRIHLPPAASQVRTRVFGANPIDGQRMISRTPLIGATAPYRLTL